MSDLTQYARQSIEQIAHRRGLSQSAVETMARAVANGGGTMAQFNIPELGGSGQWMAGGMTMVGDMFNTGLQSQVAGLCQDIAQAMSQGVFFKAPKGVAQGSAWWPAQLGSPSATGGQNRMRYAYFPQARRLVVDLGDGSPIRILDTLDHQIGGFSQQQSGADPYPGLFFSSQNGMYAVISLPFAPEAAPQPQPQPPAAPAPAEAPAQPPAPVQQSSEILEAIESLSKLHEAGVLTEDEFSAKKADLLARL